MSSSSSSDAPVRVRRYSGSARLNHWVMALSFVALLLSGLSLFHPSLFFLSGIFGGGGNVRWLHPWIGIVFAFAFLGLFLRFLPANLPEFTDFKWIAGLKHVLSGHDEYLPEVGKYNAGQKLVFWIQAALVPVMLLSGFLLWAPGLAWAEQMFAFKATIDQKRLAALVHGVAAVGAIVVWIVHVYAAIWVRGTISAMTRGTVTGGWGWRHHRRWLKKEVAEGKASVTPAE